MPSSCDMPSSSNSSHGAHGELHLAHAYDCVCCASVQIMLTLFIAIGGGLVAAFLSYHLALTAAGLTTYEIMKRQQAISCSDRL